MNHLSAVRPLVRTIHAVNFAGITEASRNEVTRLLHENRKNHIIFNDMGYHNHVVHHLLDSYALGCSPARLREVYDQHLSMQRPAPPSKLKITEANWKDHFEDYSMWTDYLNFFTEEVEKLGIGCAVDKYFFVPELFSRFYAGVHHSIIHLGFGIEFGLPQIVAEGLGLAALESTLDYVNDLPPHLGLSPSLLDLFETVHKDSRFTRSSSKSLLLEYAGKWGVEATTEDVQRKEQELFELIVLLYAATVRPGKQPSFDFYLMHSLTSSVFVHVLLKHLTPERSAQVLKAHFAVTLDYYIGAGRPELFVKNFYAYKSKLNASPNPWLEVVKFALETNDVHATKVEYSLLQGEAWFGEANGMFLKAAQMTADACNAQSENVVVISNVWSRSG